jgi:hypothetical protein
MNSLEHVFDRAAAAFGVTLKRTNSQQTSTVEQTESRPAAGNETPVREHTMRDAASEPPVTLPITKFMIGRSVGRYHMRDGRHKMQISQRVRRGRMSLKVEMIDPEHTLAKQGVVVGMIMSSKLVDDEDAISALRGNSHQQGITEKLALASFIREKIASRKTRKQA